MEIIYVKSLGNRKWSKMQAIIIIKAINNHLEKQNPKSEGLCLTPGSCLNRE